MELKHERVAAQLSSEILSGRLRHGEQLPGESELAGRFTVSRNTVRSALAELSEAGLIGTHTGKGSFVLYDGEPLKVQRGWADALAARGVDARTRVVSIAPDVDETLAVELQLPSSAVVVVERMRELHDGTVISLERSVVPAVGSLRDLPEHGLLDDSLTASLTAAGLAPHHGRQYVSGRRLTTDEARRMGRTRGEFFLRSRRTSFDRAGRFAEDVDSLLDPRHFEIGLHFTEQS